MEDPSTVRLWFGPGGTRTPLHYDDKNNLIVQVAGRKRVFLYSPLYSETMRQTRPWYAHHDIADGDTLWNKALPKTSAAELVLEPGDALFIPVGWWHAIEALEVSMTLAFVDFGVPNEFPHQRGSQPSVETFREPFVSA
jgi:ribosomal protein L16 Arg81 hydroxylase